MSEINADVEDGLDPEFKPAQELDIWQDGLVVPPTDDKTASSVTLVTSVNQTQEVENKVTAEDLFGDNLKPGMLPNLKAELAVIDDEGVKIADLREIEANISNNEAIGQDDAVAVETYFGDFLGARVELAEFSQSPSKVNYNFTAHFMTERIAQEEMQGVARIETFAGNAASEMKALAAMARTNLMPHLSVQQSVFLGQFHTEISRLLVSRNVVLAFSGDFHNVVTTALKTLPIGDLLWDALEIPLIVKNGYLESCETLIKMHECLNFAIFLQNLVRHPDQPPTLLGLGQGMEISEWTGCSAGELMTSMINGALLDQTEHLLDWIDKAASYFTKLEEELRAGEQDYNSIYRHITASSAITTMHIDRASFASEVLRHLPGFFAAVYQLTNALAKMVK